MAVSTKTVQLNQIRCRPYSQARDFFALRAFVQTGRQVSKRNYAFLHVGDVSWRLTHATNQSIPDCLDLWEDLDGRLIGFAWFTPDHNGVTIQVHPDYFYSNLRQIICQWVEQKYQSVIRQKTAGSILRIGCFDHDYLNQDLLKRLGYQKDPFHYVHFSRPLTRAVKKRSLLSGFNVRATTKADIAARAALYNVAFGTDAVTEQSYQQVRTVPDYMADLDLVAVAPSGRLAGFAQCWLDSVNRIGFFEPIGTHPDFRRHGLGKTLIYEGLFRMQTWGMSEAWIYTESPNLPAQKLYTSLDFNIFAREYDYIKDLNLSNTNS